MGTKWEETKNRILERSKYVLYSLKYFYWFKKNSKIGAISLDLINKTGQVVLQAHYRSIVTLM